MVVVLVLTMIILLALQQNRAIRAFVNPLPFSLLSRLVAGSYFLAYHSGMTLSPRTSFFLSMAKPSEQITITLSNVLRGP